MNRYIIFALLVLLVSASLQAKKLYKWVDENGQAHYSDQVPTEQIDKEHQELNDQAIVLEDVEKAKSKEQYLAERLAEKEKARQQELAEKEELKRQMIIKSYSNESEIIRLKEERLFAIEKNIEGAKQNLVFQKKSLEDMMKVAADRERSGQEVSSALLNRIKPIEQKIQDQNEFIDAKQLEVAKVNEQFDDEQSIWDRVRGVDVLILDDIGKGITDSKGQGERLLDELVRYRCSRQKITFMTLNIPLKKIGDLMMASTVEAMKEGMFPVKVEGPNLRDKVRDKLAGLLMNDE